MILNATDEEKKIIIKNLSYYPTLKSIFLEESPLLFRIQYDQYKGKIPPERFEEIAEFLIGGILLHLNSQKDFKKLIESLECWLKLYPEYANIEFGDKILSNFFNFFSEIEVYDTLKRAGCNPEKDVIINKNTKKNLDFKICPNGRDILIEITTPRMSMRVEQMFEVVPHPGFYTPEFGIETDDYFGNPRDEVIVVNKILNQISEVTQGNDSIVILIINNTYAWPNLMSCNRDDYNEIDAIIIYNSKKKISKFYPMATCCLSEKEIQFFSTLM
ncbi:hypothetical protein J2128_002469 [Methanomicrobium sp. W14]|uniref:hypothetical protein n=1 Tax=Methanomicrobium sp. W14 TaxID=2817839 RepID=UPI001AEA9A91|nr:hypothetical protein [Methanomicrobium sp. W14]MBP2134503.1 hypothetical protein [Methanomicrobium sp. W14]